MQNVLEWQKVERNDIPWQPTFREEDGTHSDSEWILPKKHLGFNSTSIDIVSAWYILFVCSIQILYLLQLHPEQVL